MVVLQANAHSRVIAHVLVLAASPWALGVTMCQTVY